MQNTARKIEPQQAPTIESEKASNISALPKEWQEISKGQGNTGLTDADAYVKMAQLFHYKMHNGDIDLFNKIKGFDHLKPAFCEMFGKLADETLSYYGADFDRERYPDFAALRIELKAQNVDADKIKVIDIAEDLFKEFGYDMPASFYGVHLAPIYRDQVCEIRPLRFSEQDKYNARAWDASLHAQKVFPMQMRIQSISSQHGFTWEHGCGCNHGLARVSAAQEKFSYTIRPEMRTTWVRDFIWTMWYEYAYFNFIPVTKFLTGDLLEFEYA